MSAAFDQITRLTRDEFYRADMNGVDWDGYVAAYRRLLPGISNDRDFGNLLAELAGELNVSHTWGSGPALPAHAGRDCQPRRLLARATGAVELDALLAGGPLEQETDLAPGARLLAVNGTELHSLNELDALLNHQAGQRLALTVQPKGTRSPASWRSPPSTCSRSISCSSTAGLPSAAARWNS